MFNNPYNIRINFNGFTCYYNDLQDYFNSINFERFKDNYILYYSTISNTIMYNFKVICINHDTKIVELIAIPE